MLDTNDSWKDDQLKVLDSIEVNTKQDTILDKFWNPVFSLARQIILTN